MELVEAMYSDFPSFGDKNALLMLNLLNEESLLFSQDRQAT